MEEGRFPVRSRAPLEPVEPPPELEAATGQSLTLYLQGLLTFD